MKKSLKEKTTITKTPEHVCFYVEQELSSYRAYKLAIVQLELDLEDIINHYGQMPMDMLSSHNEPGDPVNLAALRSLVVEEKIRYYMSRIRRLESGISLLSSLEKEVAERKYFSDGHYSNEAIIEELFLARKNFYEIRQNIIYKFSLVFGLL